MSGYRFRANRASSSCSCCEVKWVRCRRFPLALTAALALLFDDFEDFPFPDEVVSLWSKWWPEEMSLTSCPSASNDDSDEQLVSAAPEWPWWPGSGLLCWELRSWWWWCRWKPPGSARWAYFTTLSRTNCKIRIPLFFDYSWHSIFFLSCRSLPQNSWMHQVFWKKNCQEKETNHTIIFILHTPEKNVLVPFPIKLKTNAIPHFLLHFSKEWVILFLGGASFLPPPLHYQCKPPQAVRMLWFYGLTGACLNYNICSTNCSFHGLLYSYSSSIVPSVNQIIYQETEHGGFFRGSFVFFLQIYYSLRCAISRNFSYAIVVNIQYN